MDRARISVKEQVAIHSDSWVSCEVEKDVDAANAVGADSRNVARSKG